MEQDDFYFYREDNIGFYFRNVQLFVSAWVSVWNGWRSTETYTISGLVSI